ncbi:beta-glucosidase [Malassezia cuniculi]|uniref:beta-glucosidase n=1 Tax=Malassezia cuniculi TaxID=948313 RepID=A0AAF0EWI4_9BASI|nr:beta-glucosidase [Malassezia cuniculi]
MRTTFAPLALLVLCALSSTAGADLVARDDSLGKELVDTAEGLPEIKPVPFLGSDELPLSPTYSTMPNTSAAGKWEGAVKQARSYVKQFNLTGLVGLVTGSCFGDGPCVGNIYANKEAGYPGLCLQDGPNGMRGVDHVTAFPAAITTGATFNPSIFYRRGKAIGEEFKAKGANVYLGPMVNVMRAPAAGRNFEGFGADPYLNGEAAYETIRGVQEEGIQTCVKHYQANNQEHHRNFGSSNLDERTEREIYLHPFMRAIHAHTTSVMCSYNLVNNTWACQNSKLLNDRLKTELGFKGYVVSDWGGQHSGVDSALNGLDMAMPAAIDCKTANETIIFWGDKLVEAVNNGSVPHWRVEDMATRVLAGAFLVGQNQSFTPPTFNFFDAKDPATNKFVLASSNHDEIARETAAAGTVLVKNKNHTLPLKAPRSISLIGSDAGPDRLGANHYSDRIGVPQGTVGQGWGSSAVEYAYQITPYEAIQARARKNGTSIAWMFDDFDLKLAASTANHTDVAIVFVSSVSGEGYGLVPEEPFGNMGDRNNLTLWNGGEELIKTVASVNPNTVVVVHSVGPIIMEDWIEHPNITAVLMAHLPGSESGTSLVDVLYGDYNPSGRLPYTIAKKREDYPAEVLYNSDRNGLEPGPQVNFTEGVFIDYRWFDAKKIKPRYEFGYGLSYTKFEYSDLDAYWIGDDAYERYEGSWNYRWGNTTAPEGLPDWLFDEVYAVNFNLKNVGDLDGTEIPQLYIEFPEWTNEPPKVLRKFDSIWLAKQDQVGITFTLNHYDISYWDDHKQQWLRPGGEIKIHIGASSRDIRLKGKLD